MPDLTPLVLTLKLALTTTVILWVLGIPLAYWLAFSKSRFKYFIEPLVTLPLVLPPTVLGFYLLLVFSPTGFLGEGLVSHFGFRLAFSFLGLVIGSVIFSIPFMVNPIKAALQSFPVSLLETSYVLGKSQSQTFFSVIVPGIRPALWAATVMTFAHTLGEFGVVLMVGGNIPGETRVASIAIFNEVEQLNYSAAFFYSSILMGLSFVILMLFYYFQRKQVRLF